MTANAKSTLDEPPWARSRRRSLGLAVAFLALGLGTAALAAELEPAAIPAAAAQPLREVRFPKPRLPGFERFGAVGPYYPTRAARASKGGRAVIECAVAMDGALTRCRLIEELPLSEDFGAAALAMARTGWIVAAPKPDGVAEGDGEVGRFVVRFGGETQV